MTLCKVDATDESAALTARADTQAKADRRETVIL
jgi:hypothetical protein